MKALNEVLASRPPELAGMTEPEVKTALNDLFSHQLPRRAKERRWAVKSDDVFRRVVYDNIVGRPWDMVFQPPAIRNMPKTYLDRAFMVAQALNKGSLDINTLLARSNNMRSQ